MLVLECPEEKTNSHLKDFGCGFLLGILNVILHMDYGGVKAGCEAMSVYSVLKASS